MVGLAEAEPSIVIRKLTIGRFYAAYFALPSRAANGKYDQVYPIRTHFTKPKICSPKIAQLGDIWKDVGLPKQWLILNSKF